MPDITRSKRSKPINCFENVFSYTEARSSYVTKTEAEPESLLFKRDEHELRSKRLQKVRQALTNKQTVTH